MENPTCKPQLSYGLATTVLRTAALRLGTVIELNLFFSLVISNEWINYINRKKALNASNGDKATFATACAASNRPLSAVCVRSLFWYRLKIGSLHFSRNLINEPHRMTHCPRCTGSYTMALSFSRCDVQKVTNDGWTDSRKLGARTTCRDPLSCRTRTGKICTICTLYRAKTIQTEIPTWNNRFSQSHYYGTKITIEEPSDGRHRRWCNIHTTKENIFQIRERVLPNRDTSIKLHDNCSTQRTPHQ